MRASTLVAFSLSDDPHACLQLPFGRRRAGDEVRDSEQSVAVGVHADPVVRGACDLLEWGRPDLVFSAAGLPHFGACVCPRGVDGASTKSRPGP